MKNPYIVTVIAIGVVLGIVFIATGIPQPSESQDVSEILTIMGGGRSIIIGGDGGMLQDDPSLPTPVITEFAFHVTEKNDEITGYFECLALAPEKPSSFEQNSGSFTTNIMYVTGDVNSLQLNGNVITLSGKATITGVGQGVNLDFTLVSGVGGPGTLMVLTTENPDGGDALIFHEIIIQGEVRKS